MEWRQRLPSELFHAQPMLGQTRWQRVYHWYLEVGCEARRACCLHAKGAPGGALRSTC